jgi:hypothetical protein
MWCLRTTGCRAHGSSRRLTVLPGASFQPAAPVDILEFISGLCGRSVEGWRLAQTLVRYRVRLVKAYISFVKSRSRLFVQSNNNLIRFTATGLLSSGYWSSQPVAVTGVDNRLQERGTTGSGGA